MEIKNRYGKTFEINPETDIQGRMVLVGIDMYHLSKVFDKTGNDLTRFSGV